MAYLSVSQKSPNVIIAIIFIKDLMRNKRAGLYIIEENGSIYFFNQPSHVRVHTTPIKQFPPLSLLPLSSTHVLLIITIIMTTTP